MRGGAAGAAARDDRRLMKWYVADRMRFGPAMSEGVEAKHAILTGAVVADDGKRGGARERVSDRAAGPKRGLLDGGERLRRGGVFCKMGMWENYSFAISCGIDTCRWT